MVKKIIKETIKKHNLINTNEHIVIGLSGGPDSVCLFSVLNDLSREMQITLHAVHVNHGFRPGAADEDQLYVEQLCREKGVECTSFVYNCSEIAGEQGLTDEEAGRKVRYESFLKVAEQLMQQGIPAGQIKIAVAQNADDQAETVLFRMLRGSGTDGLAGIAYRRMEQNIEVVRPLLDIWRKDIEEYCNANGLAPRTDHTNLQPVYTRNKIRLELIPYLQENFNENIMGTLGRLSRIAAEDSDYLWQCADEAYCRICISGSVAHTAVTEPSENTGSETQKAASTDALSIILDQQGLVELAPAVRHRVILKALQQLGLMQDVTAAHLDAADSILDADGESKTVEFPGGYRMSVRYGEAAFYRSVQHEPGAEPDAAVGDCYQNAVFSVKVLPKTDFEQNGDSIESMSLSDSDQTAAFDMIRQARERGACQTAAFDYDKVAALHGGAQPVMRTRREGDFLAIKGGRKKLQNLFVDMKVPKEYRDSIIVAAIGSEILWLPEQQDKGIKKARYSHRCKLDIDTKNCLVLEICCEI